MTNRQNELNQLYLYFLSISNDIEDSTFPINIIDEFLQRLYGRRPGDLKIPLAIEIIFNSLTPYEEIDLMTTLLYSLKNLEHLNKEIEDYE